jgi:hypothetical protein
MIQWEGVAKITQSENLRGTSSHMSQAPARRKPHERDAKIMPENHPAACRQSAEMCRRRADAAKDAVSKVTWLKFAEEWLKLADEVELSGWRR